MLQGGRCAWGVLITFLCCSQESARGSATEAPKVSDLAENPTSSELNTEKLALSVGWTAASSCAIPRGHDVLDSPRHVSLREAHQLCSATEDCVAFTFQGEDPGLQQVLSSRLNALMNPGESTGAQEEKLFWVHFKARFKCLKAPWTSYRKLQPGQMLEGESLPIALGLESLVPAPAANFEPSTTTTIAITTAELETTTPQPAKEVETTSPEPAMEPETTAPESEPKVPELETAAPEPAVTNTELDAISSTVNMLEVPETATTMMTTNAEETDSSAKPDSSTPSALVSESAPELHVEANSPEKSDSSPPSDLVSESAPELHVEANSPEKLGSSPPSALVSESAPELHVEVVEQLTTASSINSMDTMVQEKGNGVALCLIGHPGVLEHTHMSLSANLIAPLQHPDVFIHTLQEGEVLKFYSLQNHVVNSSCAAENVRGAFLQSTADGHVHLSTTYSGIGGNWLGGECLDPVMEDSGRPRPGSALCVYHGQRGCLDMILAREASRGAPYATVVVSRLDFHWLAPHPPLKLLSNDHIWIPSGSDWGGGVNIRHAVLPRALANAYLSDAFDMIVQGTAEKIMVDAFGSNKVYGHPGLNIESYLKARLLHRKFPVERFPNVAYIACTHRQQWRAKSRGGVPQCFGAMGRDAPGWLFRDEQGHAARVAACVRGSWNVRKLTSCKEDVSHLYRV